MSRFLLSFTGSNGDPVYIDPRDVAGLFRTKYDKTGIERYRGSTVYVRDDIHRVADRLNEWAEERR